MVIVTAVVTFSLILIDQLPFFSIPGERLNDLDIPQEIQVGDTHSEPQNEGHPNKKTQAAKGLW